MGGAIPAGLNQSAGGSGFALAFRTRVSLPVVAVRGAALNGLGDKPAAIVQRETYPGRSAVIMSPAQCGCHEFPEESKPKFR